MSSAAVSRVRIPNKNKSRQTVDDDFEALKAVCVVLQAVAQKHVPETAFADRGSLVQCLRIMGDLNISFSVQARYCPDIAGDITDRNTMAYRRLKNKTIAALSTIADLDKKILDTPSTEYHNGMKAGYKKASDIALSFLADVQGESVDRYPCID